MCLATQFKFNRFFLLKFGLKERVTWVLVRQGCRGYTENRPASNRYGIIISVYCHILHVSLAISTY